jgi:GxxExxY protein
VDNTVVVELKVADELTGRHRAQLLSYLRVTGADVGLLANFGPKVDIERYAYFYAQRRPDFSWEARPPTDPDLLYPKLIGRLYECLHRVHYEIGPGFRHKVYRRAMQVELRAQNIACWYVHEIPVYYEGQYLSSRECRLLFVEDKILLAVFAVREATPAFETRMRRYLKHFGKKLGLLANFHGERLEIRLVRLAKKEDRG